MISHGHDAVGMATQKRRATTSTTQRRRSSVTAVELFGGGGQSRSGSTGIEPRQRRGSITAAELFGGLTGDEPSTRPPGDSHAAAAAAAAAAHEQETHMAETGAIDAGRGAQNRPTSSSRLRSSQTTPDNSSPSTCLSAERLATWNVPGNTLEPLLSTGHVSTSPAGFAIIYEDHHGQETGNASLDSDIADNASHMSSCAEWEAERREHEVSMRAAALSVASTSQSGDSISMSHTPTVIVNDAAHRQSESGRGLGFDGYAGQPTSSEPAIPVGGSGAHQRSPRTIHFQRMLANSPGFRLG